MDRLENAASSDLKSTLGIYAVDEVSRGPHGLWIRYPRDLEAICYALNPRKSHMWSAQIRMLWVDGCCLASPESMHAGDEFWCRFHCRRKPLTTILRMRVNEATHEEDDSWFLTCAFDHSLTHQDCCIPQ
jgi:hypothetical protein